MNEKTYYDRMRNSAPRKTAALAKFAKEGDCILDYGCGKNSYEIHDYCASIGAEYWAFDNCPEVREWLADNGFNYIEDDIWWPENKFDIIYLSSVFHELVSYLNPIEFCRTLRMIHSALKPGGKLIIRDWVKDYRADWITYGQKILPINAEVRDWALELAKNGIIAPSIFNTNDTLIGATQFQYELIIHSIWGLPSLPRESMERYLLPTGCFNYILYYLRMRECSGEEYDEFDESYRQYIEKYFSNVPEEFYKIPTKHIYVFKKGGN